MAGFFFLESMFVSASPCCLQYEEWEGGTVKVGGKAAPRQEKRENGEDHDGLWVFATDAPVPEIGQRHRSDFQHGVGHFGQERKQVRDAEIDDTHAHWVHGI